MMEPKQKVKDLQEKFSRFSSEVTAKLNTVIAIKEIIEAIKHEDNRMFYEISFWMECLEIATKDVLEESTRRTLQKENP